MNGGYLVTYVIYDRREYHTNTHTTCGWMGMVSDCMVGMDGVQVYYRHGNEPYFLAVLFTRSMGIE